MKTDGERRKMPSFFLFQNWPERKKHKKVYKVKKNKKKNKIKVHDLRNLFPMLSNFSHEEDVTAAMKA